MRITSVNEVAQLVGLHCSPSRTSQVQAQIAASGILLRGHFQLQSGAHSEFFLRARGVAASKDLVAAFAQELLDIGPDVAADGAVLCPESAGFIFGNSIAQLTGRSLVVAKTDMARRPSSELRLGEIVAGSDVLLVNDVITSGTSMKRLLAAARAHGANAKRAFALAAIGDSPLKALNELGLKGTWLIDCRWPLYPVDQCELCKQQVPLLLSAELG